MSDLVLQKPSFLLSNGYVAMPLSVFKNSDHVKVIARLCTMQTSQILSSSGNSNLIEQFLTHVHLCNLDKKKSEALQRHFFNVKWIQQ